MAETKGTKKDNMRLWKLVCQTDPKSTKGFKGKGGFTGTAICAQSQRKKATELFGPYGIGWRVEDEVYDRFPLDPADYNSLKLFYKANLVFDFDGEAGNIPIAADIDFFEYNRTYKQWVKTSDPFKKVRTDALTKGLSELGFNSDVFEGLYDDNKYVQAMANQFSAEPPAEKPKEAPVEKPKVETSEEQQTTEPEPKEEPKASAKAPANSGSFPVYDPDNCDEMFKTLIAVVNNSKVYNIPPTDLPKWMGLAMPAKGDAGRMSTVLIGLEKYVEADEAGRAEVLRSLGVK